LFSGEKPRAKFLTNNVVELETLRLLALLAPDEPRVQQIFQQANERLLPLCFANGCTVGELWNPLRVPRQPACDSPSA